MNKYQKALDDLRWIGGDGYYQEIREKSFAILQELVDKATVVENATVSENATVQERINK